MILWMPIAFVGFAFVAAFVGVKQRRRIQVQGRGSAGPSLRYLIHAINDDRCTGCETCVDACPTNVLELVTHRSRPTRFEDCVQCEKCARVCPTNALAMHLIGEQPPTIKVPDVDHHFQTRVAGQYLIGEVAGKPLVKNAANLGRAVVEHMIRTGLTPQPAPTQTSIDVVIVGSGPGGLSAAITCERHGLSYVLLEKERIMAATVLRYPAGKPFIAEPRDCRNLSFLPVFDTSKEELVETWKQLVSRLGVRLRLDEAAETISAGDEGFEVKTRSATYRGQRVVLAIGVRGKPRTLGVPGEEQRKVHMLLEDPNDHGGQHVLVVGGGDSALESAVALANAGAQVTMSYRKNGFTRATRANRDAVDGLTRSGRLRILFESTVKKIGVDDVTLSKVNFGEVVVPNAAVFVLIGADPPVRWLSKMGVQVVERPHAYSAGASDSLVASLVADVDECPRGVAEAAARVRKPVGIRTRLPLSVDRLSRIPPLPKPRRERASVVARLFGRRADTQRDEPTLVDQVVPAVLFTHERQDRSDRYER